VFEDGAGAIDLELELEGAAGALYVPDELLPASRLTGVETEPLLLLFWFGLLSLYTGLVVVLGSLYVGVYALSELLYSGRVLGLLLSFRVAGF
jgi:hypothetical protein